MEAPKCTHTHIGSLWCVYNLKRKKLWWLWSSSSLWLFLLEFRNFLGWVVCMNLMQSVCCHPFEQTRWKWENHLLYTTCRLGRKNYSPKKFSVHVKSLGNFFPFYLLTYMLSKTFIHINHITSAISEGVISSHAKSYEYDIYLPA